jgi:hypothetical protein
MLNFRVSFPEKDPRPNDSDLKQSSCPNIREIQRPFDRNALKNYKF